MDKKLRIFIAGHRGMVGSALVRLFQREGFSDLILARKSELDLRDQVSTEQFFSRTVPDIVILAAAKVGGIKANMTMPGEFLYDNLMIQNNVIHQCVAKKVRKLVFLGSSCIYPRNCPQPMKEEYLLQGALELTNEGYALAKIAGLRLAQYYNKQYGMSCLNPMPCNLYGPNDSFDLEHCHALSALVKRFSDAVRENRDKVTIWGTGTARREFLHVDDVAAAIYFLMDRYDSPEIINVGSGHDVTIRELAEMVAEKTGFRGALEWDSTMPDGMPRKCLDVTKLTALGFKPRISLEQGIEEMVREYRALSER